MQAPESKSKHGSVSIDEHHHHHHHHHNDDDDDDDGDDDDDDINNRIHRRNSRFFTISSLRREPSPTRTLKWPGRNRMQITCNTSSVCHVQHVMLSATWCEGTARLLSLTELKSHLFELYFIG